MRPQAATAGNAGAALLALQRGAGNHAVAELLQRTGPGTVAAAPGVVQRQAQQSLRRPSPLTDLKASAIGTTIRDGLAWVGVPISDGGVRPLVDPDKVLDILATSPSFRQDAATAERRNPT
jgi:hypothetical protein